MDKTLTWFIRCWVVLAVVVNVVAMFGLFLGAANFRAGLARVREIYSPFNVFNFLAEMVLLSPAIAALYLRNRRRTTKSNLP
jgi:hypothetical protein